MNAADRFFAKVQPDGNGCLNWTGATSGDGYGRFSHVPGSSTAAHRWLLERLYGTQAGLVADHLCRNPRCVRPSHIEFVTPGENIRRGVGPANARARAAARTHCSHGHPFTPENTYLWTSETGRVFRQCFACMKERPRTDRTREVGAAHQRRHRANQAIRASLGEDARVVILHGPRGPRVDVRVVAGDTDENVAAAQEKATELYLASLPRLQKATA